MREIVTTTKCDVCQETDDVTSYRISTDSRSVSVDLCSRHKAPVERVMEKGADMTQTGGMRTRLLDERIRA